MAKKKAINVENQSSTNKEEKSKSDLTIGVSLEKMSTMVGTKVKITVRLYDKNEVISEDSDFVTLN